MASRPRGSATPRVTRVFARLGVVVGLAGILLLAGQRRGGGPSPGELHDQPLRRAHRPHRRDRRRLRRRHGRDPRLRGAPDDRRERRRHARPHGNGRLRRPDLRAARRRAHRRRSRGARSRSVPRATARSRSLRAPAVCRRCASSARCTARRSSARASRSRIATGTSPGRIGWHEVTVVGDRLAVLASDAPAQSLSARLTSYPANLLQSPLDQRTASFQVGGPTSISAAPVSAASAPITRGFGDMLTTAFAGLVTTGGSTPLLWALALATAFAIGGLHALGPGHGKTLMAAYLVGSDARPRQVVAVGAAVSVMHTASVVLLGVTVLLAGSAFTPEVAYRWTTIASGALVAGLGLLSPHHATPRRPPRTRARAWARP